MSTLLNIPSALEARTEVKRILQDRKDQQQKYKKQTPAMYLSIVKHIYNRLPVGDLSWTSKNTQYIEFIKNNMNLMESEGFEIREEEGTMVIISWENATQGEALKCLEQVNKLLKSLEYMNIRKDTVNNSLNGRIEIKYTSAFREYKFCLNNRPFLKAKQNGFNIIQKEVKNVKFVLLDWTKAKSGLALTCLRNSKEYHAKTISKLINETIQQGEFRCIYKQLPMIYIKEWFGIQFNKLNYTLEDPYYIRWK